MTTSELITASLQRLGVIDADETPTGTEMNDALDRLNDLIDAWGTERLSMYTSSRTTWPITSGTAAYAIGPGSVVNRARPVYVDDIRFIDTSQDPDLEMPLSRLTVEGYAAIPQKALTSNYPTCVYYNLTYPTGTLTFWMVPTSTTLQGVIYAPVAVTELALSDTISLPPGYRRFLRDALAVELAPEYAVQPAPALMQSAIESKADVKRANIRLLDLNIDAMWKPRHGQYNIFSDTGA
jgi:hypothetical protein